MSEMIWATGRRKSAIARVRVTGGSGKLVINSKSLDGYFGGNDHAKREILEVTKYTQSYSDKDFKIIVTGGGISGQAGAIRHGLARALVKLDEKHKKDLRNDGFLTRDSREVERKKPGQPKARKRFQYSKR